MALFFLQNYEKICNIQKKVVSLHSNFEISLEFITLFNGIFFSKLLTFYV